jgi:hypothetical protein
MGEAGPGGTVRLEVCRRTIPLQPECVYMDRQALSGLYLSKISIFGDKTETRILEEL